MFSFGIEPSITSTNGASSSPRAAWRNGWRNSSPPSVGDRTLLWRCTLGSPGIAPSRTSSMLGCPAAVMETVSPSQDMPSEIQRMWTSSTPDTGSVVAMDPSSRRRHRQLRFFEFERGDLQLLARDQLKVQATAGGAPQREGLQDGLVAARPAAPDRRDHLHLQLDGAVREQLERERQRGRHDLAQTADAHLDGAQRASRGVALGDVEDGARDGELVHQQILGSGSPTS